MLVLHLTDLHLTKGQEVETLDALWASLDAHPLLKKGVDYVVLSGDLTQAAGEDEYQRLITFLKDRILPLVDDRRDRVIMVPGNHDVSWVPSDTIGTPLHTTPPTEQPAVDVTVLKRVRGWIARNGLDIRDIRFEPPEKLTGFSWWNVADKRKQYNTRFRSFQTGAIEAFYGKNPGQLKHPARAFDMTSALDEDHWSAHVFEDIAFYGFSSCASNDHLGTEACIAESAILAAANHRQQHSKEKFCVAVWHHGLKAARGGFDFVDTKTIALLRNQGFDLGIHGHTHNTEFWDLTGWSILGGMRRTQAMPIIATGSFAADPEERPEGVFNQVSVLEIAPPHVRWHILERSNHVWNELPETYVYEVSLGGGAARPSESVPRPLDTIADVHERTLTVDSQGVTELLVSIDGLQSQNALRIASPRGHEADADAHAVIYNDDHQQVNQVAVIARPDGTYVAELGGSSRLARVTWSYRVANVFALSQTDLQMDTHPRAPFLAPNEDAFMHTVQFQARKLVLKLSLPVGATNPRIVCLRPNLEGKFSDDRTEQDRHKRRLEYAPSAAGTETEMTLTLVEPRVGYQYALTYTPAASGAGALSADTAEVVSALLKSMLTSLDGSSRDTTFTAAFDEAIKETLGLSSVATWVVHLWDSTRRELRPAFGRFPPTSWASIFRYGEGIVGHAFRVPGPVLFAAMPAGTATQGRSGSQLLYRKPTAERGFEHDWLACVPLTRDGQAFGVLGLADFPGLQPWDQMLRVSVRSEARQPGAFRTKIDDLWRGASEVFWRAARLYEEREGDLGVARLLPQ